MLTSNKLTNIQESVIREMTRKSIKENAINLSQGMPDFQPPKLLIEAMKKAINSSEHQYTVTYGNHLLREKIAEKLAEYNKIVLNPEEEITVTCGASEAIASSIFAITNRGDEILILEPWYENYVPITYIAEGKPIFVALNQDTFNLDEEALKSAVTSKTKAIIVNTPHNPTGHVFTKSELKVISDLCNDHNILAITDEIYEYITYDDNSHISLGSLTDMFDKTITVSGFSKTYSMTGWRVGYVAAEKNLMAEIRKVHDYLTVCAPSLQQKALLKAFELHSNYYSELKSRYQLNRDFIVSALQDLGFVVNPPQGSYYVFADISNFGIDDYSFANLLVKNRGVAVVPGSSFYFNTEIGKRFVRFSFAQKLETLKNAIKRIEIRLKEKKFLPLSTKNDN